MRRIAALISIIMLMSFLAGCGETINGVVKDTRRIGGGVRKIFVKDSK
ncbi:MAG: hypothetical protein KAI70_04890 [Candidatus Omnitrophica bacterium]|nr:hypothetical protein [Candidatus Omnitrophota bacterium]